MRGKQQRLLQALLTEPTTTKAIEKAGLSRETAYKYLKDEKFKEELDRRRDECISDTVRYLRGRFTLCSEELIKIIEDPRIKPQIKINAINTVFQVGRGMIEDDEVLTRLREIEEAIKKEVEP